MAKYLKEGGNSFRLLPLKCRQSIGSKSPKVYERLKEHIKLMEVKRYHIFLFIGNLDKLKESLLSFYFVQFFLSFQK